jgi:uncharacterized MAPEG superfamily protein
MTIPVFVLLGFAAWTLLTLFCSVGVYRWSLILTGRASIAEFRSDIPHGADWYQRATRAHMNCIENLPVYSAIVLALQVTGSGSELIDWLSVTMLTARIVQTSVHVGFTQTNAVVSVRFGFYSVQFVCMVTMGIMTAARAI